MNIVLYNTHSETNKIIKNLTDETVVQGALRGAISIQNPTIAVQNFAPNDYNYLYLPDFGRYYYITNVTTLSKTQIELSLECDVLMSFAQDILDLDAIVSATESLGNAYLESENLVTDERQQLVIHEFSGEAFETDGEYILITAGG